MDSPLLTSVDGRISPTAEASINPSDDGLQRGDGVFEVIRLYAGRPFALGEHLDRLGHSAAAIELSFDRGALEREIASLLDEYGEHEGQLRLIATRGGRRLAFTEALPGYGETAALASVSYTPSIILNGVKSLSYAANMHATRIAQSRGADEAIRVKPDGTVLEAPTSTIFWASEGRLVTPGLEVGILASITRERVVDELDVEEGTFSFDELQAADEAFLASTVREVQPISAIDDRELPACPGALTENAIQAFRSVLDREMKTATSGAG